MCRGRDLPPSCPGGGVKGGRGCSLEMKKTWRKKFFSHGINYQKFYIVLLPRLPSSFFSFLFFLCCLVALFCLPQTEKNSFQRGKTRPSLLPRDVECVCYFWNCFFLLPSCCLIISLFLLRDTKCGHKAKEFTVIFPREPTPLLWIITCHSRTPRSWRRRPNKAGKPFFTTRQFTFIVMTECLVLYGELLLLWAHFASRHRYERSRRVKRKQNNKKKRERYARKR